MKKSACGHAPRRWWQVVEKALLGYGLVPTRADRCTYVLFGDKMSSKDSSLSKKTPTFRRSSTSSDPVQEAIDMLLDPVAQALFVSTLMTCSWAEIGDKVFADKLLANIRKDFRVGSEDKNDIMFVGQRIRWKTHDKHGPYISFDQKLAVNAVEEIKREKHLTDDLACNPQMHTAYRSVF